MDSDSGERFDAVRVLGLVTEMASDDCGSENLNNVQWRRRSVVAVTEQRITKTVVGNCGVEIRRWTKISKVFDDGC